LVIFVDNYKVEVALVLSSVSKRQSLMVNLVLLMQEMNGDEDDEDKYADDMAMPGQKFETKQRITVRNLRIREDTAKVCHLVTVTSR